ncbi:hypothetical protein G9P44_000653 [Scheffersomyces stipitis]|nr:hypothetical protein G9P44_000653 [Scheffersomyces stipitis]
MFSSKKPKFSFDLVINELTNIPQVSGSCYIDLQIRDGKKKIPNIKYTHIGGSIFDDSSKSADTSTSTTLSSQGTASTSVTSSSAHVSSTTSKKKIHNFRCVFNYRLSCNLKFPLKKKDNLIGNKWLIMKVHYVSEVNKPSSHTSGDTHEHHHYQTVEIGKVEINLSEYLNFKDPVTSKYLLKDAKVNSILSLTIALKELPTYYDFHTQLQIQDVPTNLSHSNSTKSNLNISASKKRTNATTSFNVPEFERKNVFGGIQNVLSESGTATPVPVSTSTPSGGSSNSSASSDISSEKNSKHSASKVNSGLSESKTKTSTKSHSFSGVNRSDNNSNLTNHSHNSQKSNVIMDPIVSSLYSKILESTWDPELQPLLDYNPEKCINDIFDNPENPLGINPKLSAKMGKWNDDEGDEDSELRDINGLISEVRFRDDLRSWTVDVNKLNAIK